MVGPISCNSLVTRLATNNGALNNKQISYIDESQKMIGEDYFVQGHILIHGPSNSLLFYYPENTNEIPLPNPRYHLYKYQVLTMNLEENEVACRSSVSDMITRTRSTRAQSLQPPRAQPQPHVEHMSGKTVPGWVNPNQWGSSPHIGYTSIS